MTHEEIDKVFDTWSRRRDWLLAYKPSFWQVSKSFRWAAAYKNNDALIDALVEKVRRA